MNINATLFAELILVFAASVGIICFFLAKQKGQNPFLSAVIGFTGTFLPIIAFIYLIVLLNKPNLSPQQYSN
ncbi:hypothetical protein GLIP_1034 [Aliiglaciecola lipolytica E3]|uniref:Uncharacterized protein n=1 Tax=Aliiglaciecola lipolytica E3 TaxID=1127673 RepID=K6XPR4_9ALTE|nr:hypothetical protein GLIP_1034 [Aliiglaciecola lipolytica E3]